MLWGVSGSVFYSNPSNFHGALIKALTFSRRPGSSKCLKYQNVPELRWFWAIGTPRERFQSWNIRVYFLTVPGDHTFLFKEIWKMNIYQPTLSTRHRGWDGLRRVSTEREGPVWFQPAEAAAETQLHLAPHYCSIPNPFVRGETSSLLTWFLWLRLEYCNISVRHWYKSIKKERKKSSNYLIQRENQNKLFGPKLFRPKAYPAQTFLSRAFASLFPPQNHSHINKNLPAILVFWPCSWENSAKTIKKCDFSKLVKN